MATLMNDIFEFKFYLPKVVSPRYPLKYRHNQVSYIFSTLKVLKKHQHSEILPYLPSQVPQPTSQSQAGTLSNPIPSHPIHTECSKQTTNIFFDSFPLLALLWEQCSRCSSVLRYIDR